MRFPVPHAVQAADVECFRRCVATADVNGSPVRCRCVFVATIVLGLITAVSREGFTNLLEGVSWLDTMFGFLFVFPIFLTVLLPSIRYLTAWDTAYNIWETPDTP